LLRLRQRCGTEQRQRHGSDLRHGASWRVRVLRSYPDSRKIGALRPQRVSSLRRGETSAPHRADRSWPSYSPRCHMRPTTATIVTKTSAENAIAEKATRYEEVMPRLGASLVPRSDYLAWRGTVAACCSHSSRNSPAPPPMSVSVYFSVS